MTKFIKLLANSSKIFKLVTIFGYVGDGLAVAETALDTTIQEIYGFELSQDKISTITDTILNDVQDWLNRPLKPLYSFVFVDCIYVKMKNEQGRVDNHAVYVILGVDAEGFKEVLGLYISPTESKSTWMKIFDSIKARGVEDILFLSMDGVSGLEEGVHSIFLRLLSSAA